MLEIPEIDDRVLHIEQVLKAVVHQIDFFQEHQHHHSTCNQGDVYDGEEEYYEAEEEYKRDTEDRSPAK